MRRADWLRPGPRDPLQCQEGQASELSGSGFLRQKLKLLEGMGNVGCQTFILWFATIFF